MTKTLLHLLAVAVLTILYSLPAVAQDPVTHAQIDTLLAERDAVIIELQNELRTLRARVTALEDGQSAAEDPDPGSPLASVDQPPSAESGQGGQDRLRLAVDETAAERALERTLVQAGALLLPRGAFELIPTLTRDESEFDYAVSADTSAGQVVRTNGVKRERANADLAFRFGLPGDSQFEIGLPYRSIDQEVTVSSAGVPVEVMRASASGAGDLRIGFAKTLLRENGGWRPDLIGRITYGTGSGDRVDAGVNLGGGFEYLNGSLTLVKRLDPLALLLSVGYAKVADEDGIDPGDVVQFSLGTALSVSPDSSLSASLVYASFDETWIDGRNLVGSDATLASLNFGLSTILQRGKLINVFTEIGLSSEAPDYMLGISMPMRW